MIDRLEQGELSLTVVVAPALSVTPRGILNSYDCAPTLRLSSQPLMATSREELFTNLTNLGWALSSSMMLIPSSSCVFTDGRSTDSYRGRLRDACERLSKVRLDADALVAPSELKCAEPPEMFSLERTMVTPRDVDGSSVLTVPLRTRVVFDTWRFLGPIRS